MLGFPVSRVGVFSVWNRNREIEERIAAEKRAQAEKAFEAMGGNRFGILNFYASASVIHRGEEATLCYGVSNATSVSLKPQSSPVWPSQARCVDVMPSTTTTYILTATDAAGNAKSSTVVVEVRQPVLGATLATFCKRGREEAK